MFTVLWHPAADDEFLASWMAADSPTRAEMTAAVNRLDQQMKADPTSVGESREGVDRVVFEGPLGFMFEVREPDRKVIVREVWRVR